MDKRSLTINEIELARSFYGDAINYSSVSIFERPFAPGFRISAPNGNIYYPQNSIKSGMYSKDISTLSLTAQGTFIHELAHVLQHQSGIGVMTRRIFEGGDYNFSDKIDKNVSFSKWTIEEQAQFFQELFYRQQGVFSKQFKKYTFEQLKAVDTSDLIIFDGDHCFPACISILTLSGHRPISQMQTGDIILAFDPSANFGRGALVEKRVTKFFRNTTTEWIELDLGGTDSTTGQKLTCTPGHHFLDEHGNFPTIAELLLRGGGKAKIVLEDGTLREVTGKRIVWSEEIAHLYGGHALPRRAPQTLRFARPTRSTHTQTGRVRGALLSANAASLWRASACVLTMPATMASA